MRSLGLLRLIRLLVCNVIILGLLSEHCFGQFTTILNIPPDPNIGDKQTISNGTQLNLADGGSIGFFFRAGKLGAINDDIEVNILGGIVDNNFIAASGSVVNISGGNIGDNFFAWTNAIVNISGGTIGERFHVHRGAVVNISGGFIGEDFRAGQGSQINISGGVVGASNQGTSDSFVSITGGTVDSNFVYRASSLSLSGTQFALNGADFTTSLTPNSPFLLTDRQSVLSGFLTDGSPFSFDLTQVVRGNQTYGVGSTLTVLLIPEPASCALTVIAALLFACLNPRAGY